MNQEKRLKILMDTLDQKKEMSYQEVMDLLAVSRDTARRDIVKLVTEKLAVRTHGGLMALDYHNEVFDYRKRQNLAQKEKIQIAKRAAQELLSDEVVFLDVSTIVRELCQNIHLPLTTYTHSLDNAALLGENPQVTLQVFGGRLAGNNRFLYEESTLEKIRKMRFDRAFLGCASLEEDGFYFEDETDAQVVAAVLERSRQVYLLAEHQKIQKKSTYRGGNYHQLTALITDQPLSADEKKLFPNELKIIETGGNEK